MKLTGNPPKIIILCCLAVLVFSIYFPSLRHVPRSDHLNYIADVAQYNGNWPALALKTYDLNRHCVYAGRDPLLFRPLLYFILGNEQFFFGYNFFLWQLTGILLHLFLVWQLYCLLNCIRPGLLSFIVTAFFATMFVNIEMVTWCHINAYMVALICVLIALRHLYCYLEKGEEDPKHLVLIFFSFLAAVFIFEVTVYFCMLAGLYMVWRKRSWKTALAVTLPAIIYISVSLPQLLLLPAGARGPSLPFVQAGHFLMFIKYTTLSLLWWLYSGLVPWQFHIYLGDRTIFEVYDPLIIYIFKQNSLWIGLLCFMLVCLRKGYFYFSKKKPVWQFPSFAKLILMMILGFPAFIIIGRNLPGRLYILSNHWYYHYIFWLLFVIFIYGIFSHDHIKRTGRLIFSAILLILMVVNMHMVLISNFVRTNSEGQTLRREILAHAQQFIQKRKSEPGFSFYAPEGSRGNPILFWPEAGRKFDKPISILEAFYPQYFRKNQHKYVLSSLDTL